jgi:ABC-type transport system involved in multi-copper enzyme maturation permease subunit
MTATLAIAQLVLLELLRRKDVYVLFVLTGLITLVAGAANLFEDTRVVRYVKEICLTLIWVSGFVLAVTTAARQLPAERESRTLFTLLAKPVSRWQFLAGKFLGCWLACGMALLAFYLFFGLVAVSRERTMDLTGWFQAASLQWFMLAVPIALALAGSLVWAAASSNTTLTLIGCFGIWLLGRHLHKVALGLPEPAGTLLSLLYFALPHLEIFDVRDLIIHRWPPVPWLVWLGALLYAAAYTGLALAVAWQLFRRRPLH